MMLTRKSDEQCLKNLVIESKMFDKFKNMPEFEVEVGKALVKLKYIVSRIEDNLVNVFRLDSEDCGQDIELTILRVFLNC